MSANIFIIFRIEVQCQSMAQHVVHTLSYFFFFPQTIFKTFQAKIFTVSKFTAEDSYYGLGGVEGRRETIVIWVWKKIKAAQLLNDNGSKLGK